MLELLNEAIAALNTAKRDLLRGPDRTAESLGQMWLPLEGRWVSP